MQFHMNENAIRMQIKTSKEYDVLSKSIDIYEYVICTWVYLLYITCSRA